MLIDGQEPNIPAYYILNRDVRDAETVQSLLRLTPVDIAIVSDAVEYEFAITMFPVVILTSKADEIRQQFNRPVLVMGEADFMDAVYADGRRESLTASA